MDSEERNQERDRIRHNLELDKFKRRLIRAVARLLLQEKKPEDEIWKELRKETGCDCKLLWSRMRALTIKKINLLFAADDLTEKIPKAARMSLTDWLLFDLVLAHQKINVIGSDLENSKVDPKPLMELYELVKKYKLEYKAGEDLAKAWLEATQFYNEQGHECSPMMLQRRWYQLKEATRLQFYTFWYSYRGAAKRLTLAEPDMPSLLQASIARRFKNLVITSFTEWEELIEQKLVVLAEDFQNILEPSEELEKPTEDVPDLEVIEPVIETIDLRLDSDSEEKKEDAIEKPQPLPAVKIKEEPPEMDIDIDEHPLEEPKSLFDKALEYTSLEHDTIDSIDDNDLNIESTSKEHAETETINEEANKYGDEIAIEQNEIEAVIEISLKNQQESVLPQILSVSGNVQQNDINLSEIGVLNTSINNTTITDVVETVKDVEIHTNTVDPDEGNKDKCDSDNYKIIATDTILDINTNENVQIVNNNTSDKEIQDSDIAEDSHDVDTRDEDIQSKEISILDANSADVRNVNTNIFDKNIPGVLDKVPENINTDIEKHSSEPLENLNEDTVMSANSIDEKSPIATKPELSNFSFGELSNDINFVDDGIEFVDDGIVYHEEENEDDLETKVKFEKCDEQEKKLDTPKIDEKLLMVPIVYTTRIDDMDLFHTQPFDHVANYKILDIIYNKSKPVKEVPNDKVFSDEEDDMDIISESQKVKETSYLLQKPRSRTYNPIQLCKNPDFNTRLKRLNIGFYGSQRNLVLLKSCKPMTIDLSKAFESKLVDGTLYLKPDLTVKTEIIDKIDTESSQNVTVVPSAMPVQSLIDNTKISDLPILQSRVETPKPSDEPRYPNVRNKVINLPDISEIRRINQRLLTAEVAPIQVQNNKTLVPVSIVASSDTIPVFSVRNTVNTISNTGTDSTTPSLLNRGPPKLVDITEDSPSVNNANKSSTKSLNTGFATRLQQKRPWVPKSVAAPWKSRQLKPKIPWLENMENSTCKKMDETLLTLDTLNKMLYLLSSDKEDVTDLHTPGKKIKRKKKPPKEVLPSPDDSDVQVMSDADNSTVQIKKCSCKPKINIKPGVNGPAGRKINRRLSTIDLVEQNEDGKKFSEEKSSARKPQGKLRYCCWSRQRMAFSMFSKVNLPTHDCPSDCRCCCRGLLAQYLINERKLYDAEQQLSTSDEIVIESINSSSEITEACVPDESPPNTPFIISSVQSLVTNPIITSIQSLVTNPIISSVQSLVTNPVISSVQTLASNPVISSIQTLASNPVISSIQTLAINPVISSVQTLTKNPVISSVQTLAKNPVISSVQTLAKNPVISSVQTLAKNPVISSVKTLATNPIISSVESLAKTPFITSVKTLVQTAEVSTQVNVEEDIELTNDVNATKVISLDEMVTRDDEIPPLGGEVLVTTSVSPDNVKVISGESSNVKINNVVSSKLSFKKGRLPTKKVFHVRKTPNCPLLAEAAKPLTVNKSAPGIVSQSNAPSLRSILENKRTYSKKMNVLKSTPTPTKTIPMGAIATSKNFKERVLYLNSKQLADKPSDNPIFLGKNKILLTTVKFPPNLKKFEEIKQVLKPQLKLPNGVQLILLPNGTVTHVIDPKVDVNPFDLNNVPAIIEAVQKQINGNVTSEAKDMDNDVVDLIDDDEIEANTNKEKSDLTPVDGQQINEVDLTESREDSPNVETAEVIENKENCDVPPSDCKQVNDVDLTESNDDVVKTALSSNVPNNDGVECRSINQNIVDDTTNNVQRLSQNDVPSTSAEPLDTPSDKDTIIPNEEIMLERSSGNKTKNILSDLMEMSGIFDEDITPTDIQPSDVHTTDIQQSDVQTIDLEPSVIHPIDSTSTDIQETNIQATNIQSPNIQLVELSTSQEISYSGAQSSKSATDPPPLHSITLPPGNYKTPVVNSPLGELTPITSLYELKYACLNNGVFFKLDFDTGYLVPINVCLKQQTKAIPLKKIETKSVIDLTDDDDANNVANTTNKLNTRVFSPVSGTSSTLDMTEPSTSNTSPTTSMTAPKTSDKKSLLLVNNSDAIPKPVKPIKLFKSIIHPRVLRKMQDHLFTADKKSEVLIPVNKTYYKSHKLKRKQLLKDDDLRNEIDLSQEDEEPCKKVKKRKIKEKAGCAGEANDNTDSSTKEVSVPIPTLPLDSNKETVPREIATKDDSDDSSDEEPLANLVKRKRAIESAPIKEIEVEIQDAGNMSIDETEKDNENDNDNENNDIEMESETERQEGQYELHFDSGSEEEGCILGV